MKKTKSVQRIQFAIAAMIIGVLLIHQNVSAIDPTHANVAYGEHKRQVLDFYAAESIRPTPVVIYLHGGGWVRGDKNSVPNLNRYLSAGVSVAAVRYRYSHHAQINGVTPPVKAPMQDAARALQFVRSKAIEWSVDSDRIAATGNSAGACTSLWIALHDDMSVSNSDDPVARQSTRLTCVAVREAQTSLDPKQMAVWTPNSRYGGGAFGFMDPKDTSTRDSRFADFLANRDALLPWIQEYSPIAHASPDDPPVYMWFSNAPEFGKPAKDPTHSANFGLALKNELDKVGVACELVYPGAEEITHESLEDFLVSKLTFDTETIPLWTDEQLGNTAADDTEVLTLRGWNNASVREINRPTLAVYHPTLGENSETGVIICPGGGYSNVVVDKEGHDLARWLARQGVTAGVLKYRCGGGANEHPIPMNDARRAIEIFRENASRWKVASDRIGIAGFSAGGHLAATIATDSVADASFAALIYPVISMQEGVTHRGSLRKLLGDSPSKDLMQQMSLESQVTADTCPTFLVHSSDDAAVPAENSLLFYQACRAHGVPAELHLYPDGGHGFGMHRDNRVSHQWPESFNSWLSAGGWLRPAN